MTIRKRITFKNMKMIFSTPKKNSNFKIFVGTEKEENREWKIKAFINELNTSEDITGYFTLVADETYGDQYSLKTVIDYHVDEHEMETVLTNLLGKISTRDLFSKEPRNLDTYYKIINNEYDLTSLNGVGDTTAKRIQKKVIDKLDVIILYSLTSGYGVTENMASKILSHFPSLENCIDIIKNDPYKLQEISNIGFSIADKIAVHSDQDMPIEKRVTAAALKIIEDAANNGSTFVNVKGIQKTISEKMKVENVPIDHLKGNQEFYVDDSIIAKRTSVELEGRIAHDVYKKLKNEIPFPLNKSQINEFLEEYQVKNNFIFTDKQKDFLHLFTNNSVVCLLGYAGTGKSAIQKATSELCKLAGWSINQSAPTGRAAQVMKEYTGIRSSTLHKQFNINSKDCDPGMYRVHADVLLVDEGSMIDIVTGEYLTKGAEIVKRLVIVGDPEQLPSVGAGRFLQDIIDGGVPHVELTDVFRQSEGGILDMATKARQGKNIVPSIKNKAVKMGKDAIFHEVDKDNLEQALIHYMNSLLKKVSLEDITIITPKNVGVSGTEKLNQLIQSRFNPKSPSKKEVEHKNNIFRVGDTVLCTKNSSVGGRQVNNGELGIIKDIGTKMLMGKEEPREALCLTIDFGEHTVDWEQSKFKDLNLGYAISIHKMQGSSNKVIIMIADKSSTYMLNRQLIYTGLTRPQKRLILLGDPYTINTAVRKDGSAKRNTMLATYLKKLVHKKEKLK